MTDHTNTSASEVNILQRGCDSLLAEVARLTQELDLSRFTLRELRAQQVEDFDRAAAAEARLAALTAKVEKHEKRPWPGCKMLSLGDACTCALCEHDRKMAALTAALDGLEHEIRAQSSKGFIATQLSCWADRLAALRTGK